jgi:transcriptional regulator with XRE-family HTH domain
MITQLLSGAFAGRGGNRALCRALGVTKLTLHHWRKGKHEPTYEHRQALIAIWRAEVGE